MATSVISTGGLIALVVHPVREFVNRFGRTLHSVLVSNGVKKLRAKNEAENINPNTQTGREQNENQTRERRKNDD
jgi:hypothetical protein